MYALSTVDFAQCSSVTSKFFGFPKIRASTNPGMSPRRCLCRSRPLASSQELLTLSLCLSLILAERRNEILHLLFTTTVRTAIRG